MYERDTSAVPRSHSSHRVTHGPIPGGYENRPNAAESSGRGGADAICLRPEFLWETASHNKSFRDTSVMEHSERSGNWTFSLGVAM